MQTVYSPKETATLLDVSSSAIRNYSKLYADYLSDAATQTPRQFTEADLKVVAYVAHCTQKRAMTHQETIKSLSEGALDEFDWELPEGEEAAQKEAAASEHLVPMAQLQATQAIVAETQRREREAQEKVDQLQQEIKELTLQLGEAQGELEARKRRRPGWLKALIGE